MFKQNKKFIQQIKLQEKLSYKKFVVKYSQDQKSNQFQANLYTNENKDEIPLSFWKDIPLQESNFQKDQFNVCFEIPKNRLAKFELIKEKPFHPIQQDTRKNKFNPEQKELRYYAQFPLFNYGFLPQTWENNQQITQEGFKGDGDPVDICDLSKNKDFQIGDIQDVKILGAFCLIDQGEVDWKILTINYKEAQDENIQCLQDVEKQAPGRLSSIKNWFKFIKTYDGKKQNVIHYDEKIFNVEETLKIIRENNIFYQELLSNPSLKGIKKEYNL